MSGKVFLQAWCWSDESEGLTIPFILTIPLSSQCLYLQGDVVIRHFLFAASATGNATPSLFSIASIRRLHGHVLGMYPLSESIGTWQRSTLRSYQVLGTINHSNIHLSIPTTIADLWDQMVGSRASYWAGDTMRLAQSVKVNLHMNLVRFYPKRLILSTRTPWARGRN